LWICADGTVGEQQAVGQVGEGIVVGQVGQFVLGILDRADVGEHRHIVAELAVIILDGADGLPLRVNLAALAAVPDFPAPLASGLQGLEHRLVEIQGMVAGLEHAGLVAQDFLTLVTGDFHEGPVDVDDLAASIADQHPFAGAVEYRCRLAQTLAVFTLVAQAAVGAQKAQQSGPGTKDQRRADRHPDITIDQLPTRQVR
jgi:hypothetical protein